MDQKVLASLVDRKAYNKLANNTIDLKALKENEIEEIFSAKPFADTQNIGTDEQSADLTVEEQTFTGEAPITARGIGFK